MNSLENISGILNAAGCGSTLDTFRGGKPGSPIMLQWLWAAPLGPSAREVTAQAEEMVQSISDSGFSASSELNDFFALANEMEKGGACPFRPVSCSGDHVIVSGAGYLTENAGA